VSEQLMFIDFLLHVFQKYPDRDAIVWRDQIYSYQWLIERIAEWKETLISNKVSPGSVVCLEADFSPNSVAALLALIDSRNIMIPLTAAVGGKKTEFLTIGEAELSLNISENEKFEFTRYDRHATHQLYLTLRERQVPGLVLFSSGSTGQSKAAVHDFDRLLQKYRTPRQDLRTLTFLLFDHIGGIDTLLYSLSNGSCVITVPDRSPDTVLGAVERYRGEVLPVTPTFLNLIILSEAYSRYDLSSLKYITYGTEIMPEGTLKRCAELFPHVTLLQKFGTTETGTLRSKSRSSDSVWVKIGGDGFQTRVVDGILQIKAESAMLGYLNAPSPFTEDGWFNTGDSVLTDGEFIRFLGRKSEIINVGGEKVYPAEVENVIQEIDNVAEVSVYGEKNPLTGNIVCARVTLVNDEDPQSAIVRIKTICRETLNTYKVPVRIQIVVDRLHSDRFKKIRPKE
jgi:acyl-CoA synthetase (AMP-forming)/AMP-acid ligase II